MVPHRTAAAHYRRDAELRTRRPRIDERHSEWLKVPFASRHDRPPRRLGQSTDECVIERDVFGHSIGGEDTGCRQIKRKTTASESISNAVLEPATQNHPPVQIGSFLCHDTSLNLAIVVAVTKATQVSTARLRPRARSVDTTLVLRDILLPTRHTSAGQTFRPSRSG